MFEKMNSDFILNKENKIAEIKIFGVGGGGSNAVAKMINDDITGLDFYIANTDKQALNDLPVQNKIILGENLTKGLGAGSNPEIGQKSATESLDEIKEIVKGTDLIFVTAGMGGGTGTGAAPIIAKASKEAGALVVGIVTSPFGFEGKSRNFNASKGIEALAANVDSLIIISNNRLLHELGGIPLTDSFQYADAILKQAVRTITDLITKHSLINLDFADIKTVLKDKGLALIGTGKASGENAAVEAAIQAINSPILESSIEGADSAIVNILGGPKTLTINQAQQAVQTIKEASESNNIDVIFGITIDENMGDEIVVSVIATGIQKSKSNNSNSLENTDKNLFSNDIDIEKYKSGLTKELPIDREKIGLNENKKPNNLSEEKTEDIFKTLGIFDDEEEETEDLDNLFKED